MGTAPIQLIGGAAKIKSFRPGAGGAISGPKYHPARRPRAVRLGERMPVPQSEPVPRRPTEARAFAPSRRRIPARCGPALAVLVAVLLLPAGPAEAGTRQKFWAGTWSGWAYSNDSGGFLHCGVSRLYPDGIRLVLSLSAARIFTLSLIRRDWRLERGAKYQVTVVIDDFWRREILAEAPRERLLMIPLPYDKSLVQFLRRAITLTIHDGQSPHDFALAGSSAALSRLEACVEARVNPR